MTKKVPNYAISFAQRYSDPISDWLTAYSAITRIEALIEDAQKLQRNFEIVEPREKRWQPWVGAEIISYYSVGYVTCLEWHARSRLVDLLTYLPSAVKQDDVKQIRDSVVVEMLTENVTIAQIVGASTNVSSFESYMNIMGRLFESLKIPMKPFQAIKLVNKADERPWIDGDEIEHLNEIYRFRNHLVHEIGISTLCHPNIRDSWSPETALAMGNFALRVIHGLEEIITKFAPNDFPNKLSADRYPVDRFEVFAAEIPRLEARIEQYISELDETGTEDTERWLIAKEAARVHLYAEEHFLSRAAMLGYKYLDMRSPLRAAAAKARHAYLISVLEMIGDFWHIGISEEDNEKE